ncbi:MAG TPA: AtzG-like protein [Casimicrobiaceae bacterium]|nr:AtzG-like protein [Casimicrobiaceae bacterium]
MTSFDPHAYLDACAAALDLPIPVDQRDAVAANLARLELLARQLADVELSSCSSVESQTGT